MPQFFIDRPVFAWVIAIIITGIGLFTLAKMPVAQYPNIAPPAIVITASYPGASAQEIAESVSSVIENQLNGAKGLLYYESVSNSSGSATITATFAPGTNVDMAQVDLQTRVSNITAQLPQAVAQQGLKFSQSNSTFLLIASLSSQDGSLNETQLADYVVRNIQNNIARVPGVGAFQLFDSSSALRVWLNPEKLVGLSLAPSDVTDALRRQNLLITAGTLGAPPNPETNRITIPVVVNGQLRTVEDFQSVIIRANPDGSSVRLSEVARVEVASDNYLFSSRLDGKQTSAFAISLTSTANALTTSKAVKEELALLAQYFPSGVTYSIPFDTSPYISLSIKQVVETLVEAMILVFLVMFLFLQKLRYTLIPTIVVPVAMLGAFTVMNALGMSINVLTLFAMVLAIGIVVDDAIVVVEAVEHLMQTEGLSPKEATMILPPKISGAIVGITVVLSVVFLPLAFMSGSVGVIYMQFAAAMAVSIIFSGFLALSFTPALCATVLKAPTIGNLEKKGIFGWFNRFFSAATERYERGVKNCVVRSGRIMLIYALLVCLLGWLYLRMPTSFLPEEDQGYVATNILLPGQASATRTLETVKAVEQYFMQNEPNTLSVLAIQGTSFYGAGLNAAQAFVTLKDFSLRKEATQSASAIARKATDALQASIIDGLVATFTPPAIPALGNTSGFDFRLQDLGNLGYSALMAASVELISATLQSPVLSQVAVSGLGPAAQLSLKIDRQKAAALGVDFADAASIIATAIGTEYAGKFPNKGRVQNIWAQADVQFRTTLEDVLRLNTRNVSGAMVPLSSFITASWEVGPTEVVRYNNYPAVRIGGNAAPGYSSGQAMQAMQELMTTLPKGFGYAWTAPFVQEQQAGNQVVLLMLLALVSVFLVLCALYNSWAIPVAVILIVPLGMLGAVGLVTAVGLENNVYFTVGMVTVIGLAAKNAILIIEYAKERYDEGTNLVDSALYAAAQRFRPIVMTSIAFILGVVPLILASGAGAASQKAVGFGVLGGMLAATPFAVFFVPVFFVVVLRLFRVSPLSKRSCAAQVLTNQAGRGEDA